MPCAIPVSGVLPKDAPFFLHAILIHHYWNGSYYPVGGPSEIAYQMATAIEQLGGQVLVQAPVTDILCEDSGTVIGEYGWVDADMSKPVGVLFVCELGTSHSSFCLHSSFQSKYHLFFTG